MGSASKDLTELVFEGLDAAKARSLSQALVGELVELPTLEAGLVERRLSRLEIREGAALINANVRILRYDGDVYDIEVNFVPLEAACAEPEALTTALHEFAMHMSREHGIASFYAGLEPASDEETRFFTGAERGPYF